MARAFKDLSEREVLALAISQEENDGRIYSDLAEKFRVDFPATSKIFKGMQDEESEHRQLLIDRYRERFGEHIPLIRREDVKGFTKRRPVWMQSTLRVEAARKLAESMEMEAQRYYETAAKRSTDAATRKLLGDLAETERKHAELADSLERASLDEATRTVEADAQKRIFILQVVQPGLAGLMDGSVSTLAPLFAAAFATHNTWDTFRVGLAASIGAGISMGFAEALSDDGTLSGRGRPFARGVVCGLMTTIGGIGHTLPYLLPNFHIATSVAVGVVAIELGVISYIRYRFMDTPLLSAAFQVIVGGVLVFITGIVIGSS